MPTRNWSSDQSLNDWHHMFGAIYGNRNSERDQFKLFAHLAEIAGGFSKIVRKGSNPAEVALFLGKLLAWFCALSLKLNHRDLESLVWNKYPSVCPYCGRTRCNCQYYRPPGVLDNATLRRFGVEHRTQRPSRLIEWQDMFSGIYGTPNRIIGNSLETSPNTWSQLVVALNRLYEEMGELAEAIRLEHVTPIAVSSELADVFAWIMAVSNMLPEHLKDPGFNLERAVWDQYPGKCNYCYANQCVCPNDRVRESLIASVGAESPYPTDHLTKLPRRDAFEKEMSAAVNEATADRPLSLIVIDLDHFKQVNEEWGHSGGDTVLRIAAEVIARHASLHGGTAYRWGGEEFMVLLPGFDIPSATQCASELLGELRNTEIGMEDGRKHAQTGSAGIATTHGSTGKAVPEAMREMFDAADKAVFEAKKAGRDQVVASERLGN